MIETHWLMDDLIIIRVESTVRELHEIKCEVGATVYIIYENPLMARPWSLLFVCGRAHFVCGLCDELLQGILVFIPFHTGTSHRAVLLK